MIDKDSFLQLQHDVGEQLATQLLEVYLTESLELIEKLSPDSSQELLEITAHSLKSSSRSYGAFELALLCEKIEHQVKTDGINAEVIILITEVHAQSLVTFSHARELINSQC
jgi:HPt (histidine-containing phosphotransfer) domain-containing protein